MASLELGDHENLSMKNLGVYFYKGKRKEKIGHE
jgi:hypothetical protein